MASAAGVREGATRTAYVKPSCSARCAAIIGRSVGLCVGRQADATQIRTGARSAYRLPAAFEGRVRCTSAYAAAYVGFSGRLREREEMCAEASFAIGAEHLLAEVLERAFQIAERDALVYHQAFALRELGKVRRIGNVATVYLARSNDVNRKILVFHNVNLKFECVAARRTRRERLTARPKGRARRTYPAWSDWDDRRGHSAP